MKEKKLKILSPLSDGDLIKAIYCLERLKINFLKKAIFRIKRKYA